MNKVKRFFRKRTPSQKIAMSFLGVILVGAFLLCLPIANKNNSWQDPINALFTSTSATCVTGLAVTTTIDQYNVLGQLVILALIQVGGLGLMTLVATFLLVIRSKLSLQHKIAMKEMLNQKSISDLKGFLIGICGYTLFFEGVGSILLMLVFVPEFGVINGIWKSVFISISAFCNAGFDIIGAASLAPYIKNPIVNFTVMALIVCGGLGFAVWFDGRDKLKKIFKNKVPFKKAKHALTLHSKFVILTTLILIFIPALLILCIEWNNPSTLGNLNIFEKIQSSLFESVTFRTAGFATFDNGLMRPATKFLGMICMFIGGSPGGTAGGIKTTTIAVIIACVACRLRGKTRTEVYGRHISREIIVQATMIVVANVSVLFIGIFALSLTEPFDFSQICFEVTSALATVGLTTGITPHLSVFGKIVITLLMYVGRVGIMTTLMSFTGKHTFGESIELPEGHVMVG